MEIELRGPAAQGRLAVDYLAALAKELQSTLRRLAVNREGKAGRYPKEVERACSLDFVGFSAGSVCLAFELAPTPEEERTLWLDAGRQSLSQLMALLKAGEEGEENWSAGVTAGVLDGLDRITRPLENGINAIGFRCSYGEPHAVRVTRAFRTNLTGTAIAPQEAGETRVEGVIWEADWKRHTAQLHRPDGTIVMIAFDPDRDEEVTEARKRRVAVTGITEPGPGRLRVSLRRLTILDPAPLEQPSEGAGFWEVLSIEELAERQGVEPAPSIDALGGDWPEDEDLDEFIDSLRATRQ